MLHGPSMPPSLGITYIGSSIAFITGSFIHHHSYHLIRRSVLDNLSVSKIEQRRRSEGKKKKKAASWRDINRELNWKEWEKTVHFHQCNSMTLKAHRQKTYGIPNLWLANVEGDRDNATVSQTCIVGWKGLRGGRKLTKCLERHSLMLKRHDDSCFCRRVISWYLRKKNGRLKSEHNKATNERKLLSLGSRFEIAMPFNGTQSASGSRS